MLLRPKSHVLLQRNIGPTVLPLLPPNRTQDHLRRPLVECKSSKSSGGKKKKKKDKKKRPGPIVMGDVQELKSAGPRQNKTSSQHGVTWGEMAISDEAKAKNDVLG